jgi:hypothetical protein
MKQKYAIPIIVVMAVLLVGIMDIVSSMQQLGYAALRSSPHGSSGSDGGGGGSGQGGGNPGQGGSHGLGGQGVGGASGGAAGGASGGLPPDRR